MALFNALLNRVQLCNAEVPGIKTSLRLAPPTVKNVQLPLVYLVPLGFADEDAPGQHVRRRTYRLDMEVLIRPDRQPTPDGDGAVAAIAEAVDLVDAISQYYDGHRDLHTATAGEWEYIADWGIRLACNAVGEIIPGPINANFFGALFTLEVRTLIEME